MLIEKDNTFSAIRIVDEITRSVVSPVAPDEMAPFAYQLTMLVMIKSGAAHGRATLWVRTRMPSGLLGSASSSAVELRGDDHGHIVPVRMDLQLEHEGVYWFELWLDDRLLTKVPLRVRYRPVRNP